MDVPVLDPVDRLAPQARRIPVGNVGVFGIEQVEHVETDANPTSLPIPAEIDESCRLRTL